jgi:phospholipase C
MRRTHLDLVAAVFGAALLACIAAACGGGAGSTFAGSPHQVPTPVPSTSPGPLPSPSFDPSLKIQHVVIIIQENRSFDNMFNGFPGADTAQSGKMSNGQTVQLTQIGLDQGFDLRHRHYTWWTSWDNGNMDGFDVDRNQNNPATFAYQYVRQPDVQLYWDLASKYTLADRMFQSNASGSYPAHLYLVAAQSQLVIGNPTILPWGCDSPSGSRVALVGPNGTERPGPFPCFNYATLADLMDQRGMTWRFYAPAVGTSGAIWSAFDSFSRIRNGPEWADNVLSPETRVVSDIAAGSLAQVTWVVPSGGNSDHAGSYSKNGPNWVTSIVDAVGASPFWNNTAIFITWDDWGGWYDHVPPPQLDEMGLSFRVPLLVVSPYARHGYVSHVQHEFGSILHFTEQNFGMPSLGQTDARADDLLDCFDFTQSPAPFVHLPFTAQRKPPAETAPDDDF